MVSEEHSFNEAICTVKMSLICDWTRNYLYLNTDNRIAEEELLGYIFSSSPSPAHVVNA